MNTRVRTGTAGMFLSRVLPLKCPPLLLALSSSSFSSLPSLLLTLSLPLSPSKLTGVRATMRVRTGINALFHKSSLSSLCLLRTLHSEVCTLHIGLCILHFALRTWLTTTIFPPLIFSHFPRLRKSSFGALEVEQVVINGTSPYLRGKAIDQSFRPIIMELLSNLGLVTTRVTTLLRASWEDCTATTPEGRGTLSGTGL